MDHPLQPIVSAWLSKIRLAMEFKKKKFQDDADEAMFFYHGPYNDMYGAKRGKFSAGFSVPDDFDELPTPGFGMTVNKVAELVQLFGPALYHKNPIRQVNPRKAPMLPIEIFGPAEDPNVQMGYAQLLQQVEGLRGIDRTRSILLEHYLNYTPTALDLKRHFRWAIDEAIIKGMGVIWSEVYRSPGMPTPMVGSFFETVDNLVGDPDMECFEDAKWIARKCCHPVWEVEKEYNLAPGSLKGNLESYNRQANLAVNSDGDYNRKRGMTNDLLVYWKIFSKMGMGGRLSAASGEPNTLFAQETLDVYGNFVYLVVAHDIPYPLNLPPEMIATANDQQIMQALQWPTPFWRDDSWPFTPIAFHWIPREMWPMSHIKPAMGELKFINWAYSMIASKIRVACRDFIAIVKSSSEELKESIKHGPDYSFLEIESLHGNIDQVVKFLQHPEFNPEIYNVIKAVEGNFEKRTGLTELFYGLSARQMRSAEEAAVKGEQISVRPDDMANIVEDAASDVAKKEALCARTHLNGQQVAPMLGPLGAQWWDQFVVPADPSAIVHQLEYRIEAGSAKKPNKDRDASNMQQAMQTIFQPLWQYAMQTGDLMPANKLISDWAKSIDLDPTGYLLKPPPMPPPMPGQGGQPQPGQAESQQQGA